MYYIAEGRYGSSEHGVFDNDPAYKTKKQAVKVLRESGFSLRHPKGSYPLWENDQSCRWAKIKKLRVT